MRPLSPSEKRLAGVLAGVVLLVGNLVVLPRLADQQSALRKQITELESQLRASRTWLAEEAYWKQREEWLKEHQPVLKARSEASSSFLELLQKGAEAHSLEILEQSLLEVKAEPDYQSVGVRIAVAGPMDQLARWLADLQQPDAFVVVPSFSIKAAGDPPGVRCDLELERWYQP